MNFWAALKCVEILFVGRLSWGIQHNIKSSNSSKPSSQNWGHPEQFKWAFLSRHWQHIISYQPSLPCTTCTCSCDHNLPNNHQSICADAPPPSLRWLRQRVVWGETGAFHLEAKKSPRDLLKNNNANESPRSQSSIKFPSPLSQHWVVSHVHSYISATLICKWSL